MGSEYNPSHSAIWVRYGLDPGASDQSPQVHDGILIQIDPQTHRLLEIRNQSRPDGLPDSRSFDTHLLTPGLLNAHVHLDYSFLAGALPCGPFTDWLDAMITVRRQLSDPQKEVARDACQRSIEAVRKTGTTEVWDISSYGWARDQLCRSGLAGISFEELLAPVDADWPARWQHFSQRFEKIQQQLDRNRLIQPGLSAHAPYTVCPPALNAIAQLSRQHSLPVAIHLAESPEEQEMMLHARGPLLELLKEVLGGQAPDFLPSIGSLEAAGRCGLLGPQTLAIHCNLPFEQDYERLAANRTVVVFCPRSHRFFNYPDYPLKEFLNAGVRIALGTDSLASNHTLSMHDETHALLDQHQWLSPLEGLSLATGAGLGNEMPYGRRGRLHPGAAWAIWDCGHLESPHPDHLAERWLDPMTRCVRSSAWQDALATQEEAESSGA